MTEIKRVFYLIENLRKNLENETWLNLKEILFYKCGEKYQKGNKDNCKVIGKTCCNCGKMNHLSNICRLKRKQVSKTGYTKLCNEPQQIAIPTTSHNEPRRLTATTPKNTQYKFMNTLCFVYNKIITSCFNGFLFLIFNALLFSFFKLKLYTYHFVILYHVREAWTQQFSTQLLLTLICLLFFIKRLIILHYSPQIVRIRPIIFHMIQADWTYFCYLIIYQIYIIN